MPTKKFEPKFMKVGVLTAALQELTPRKRRDPDPDLAIEEWLDFASELGGRLHPAFGGAASFGIRRAAGGDARSGGEHARSPQAVRQEARQPRRAGDEGDRGRDFRHRLLRQHAARRPGASEEEDRLHAARLRCGVAARRQRRLRLRRPQPAAQHGPESRRLRGALHPAAEGRRRTAGSPIASSSARCPAGPSATTGTTTSPTRRAPGSRCTGSARSTASAISSASTTTRRTRS